MASLGTDARSCISFYFSNHVTLPRLAEPDTLTPLGYVSAKFIFDSVAKNALQDIETYK